MRDFNELMGIADRQRRLRQQDVTPQAVKQTGLDSELLRNSPLVEESFSLANGVTATITTTITAEPNPDVPLGAVPFMFAFWETSKTTANLIPFGSGIATGRYTITGPMAMPQISPGGTDGNNLVFKTSIANNSGSLQSIIFIVESRLIRGAGGGGA